MFVHASRIEKQISYLESLGYETNSLLEEAEVSREELVHPDKLFSFEQYHLVLKYALEQTENSNYGLEFGSNPYIGGTVGMLAASCSNLEEAFIQGSNFLKVQGNFSELAFNHDASTPYFRYKIASAWTLQHPETAKIEVDAMFAFLATIMKINSNHTLKPLKIHLAMDSPDDPRTMSKYEEILGVMPRFEKEHHEMYFRKSDLQIPMKAFNPETFRILKAHIRGQLNRVESRESIADRVKHLLLSGIQYQFPDIHAIAERLNISARTLQRQLEAESTSFKEILLETKFDMAKRLLERNQMTISEISFTLGYSDAGNFSRSFKKQMGMSPQEYRSGS